MSPTSRRIAWTAVLLLAAAGAAFWLITSPGSGASPAGRDAPGSGQAADADSAPRAAAGSAGAADTTGRVDGDDLALPEVDLEEGVDLSGEFEPPASPRVHRWELFRDGGRVGSFRAELARGQEGMVELQFRLETPGGTSRGSVTTASRLFYRYARLAVEAEAGSPLPLLTVLVPPALEAVLHAREPTAGREAGAGGGEPVTVAGESALRFTRTVRDVRIETDVVPGRLLPLGVRTTLPDGTVLEARPIPSR